MRENKESIVKETRLFSHWICYNGGEHYLWLNTSV